MCEACAEFVRSIHGQESADKKLELERFAHEERMAQMSHDSEQKLAQIAREMNEDDNEAELVEAETEAEVLSDVVEQMNAPDENTVVIETSEDADLDGEPFEEEPVAEAPPAIDEAPPSAPKKTNPFWGR